MPIQKTTSIWSKLYHGDLIKKLNELHSSSFFCHYKIKQFMYEQIEDEANIKISL